MHAGALALKAHGAMLEAEAQSSCRASWSGCTCFVRLWLWFWLGDSHVLQTAAAAGRKSAAMSQNLQQGHVAYMH